MIVTWRGRLYDVNVSSSSLFKARQPLAQGRGDAGANSFDGSHELHMWQGGYVHLKREAGDTAQRFAVPNDLLDYFFGAAHEQRALRGSLRIEVGTGDGRPSAFLRDRGESAGVAWEEVIDGFLRRRCDIAQGVYAHSQLIGRVSEPLAGFAVEIDKRPEAPRFAADDRDH